MMVVSCVHLAGVPLSFYPPPIRFSVGWYTVVIINLIANSLVLVVLLVGISKLYARVLLAVLAFLLGSKTAGETPAPPARTACGGYDESIVHASTVVRNPS